MVCVHTAILKPRMASVCTVQCSPWAPCSWGAGAGWNLGAQAPDCRVCLLGASHTCCGFQGLCTWVSASLPLRQQRKSSLAFSSGLSAILLLPPPKSLISLFPSFLPKRLLSVYPPIHSTITLLLLSYSFALTDKDMSVHVHTHTHTHTLFRRFEPVFSLWLS